jgi:hypothetical protein
MHAKKMLLSTLVLITMVALLVARSKESAESGTAMTKAATAFLSSLTAAQQKQATFAYNDPERLNWHYIPRVRKGLPLRDLEGKALKAAEAFIASGLSSAGYDQAVKVMSLEEVLFLLETSGTREERRERRHPKKYYLSVFGKPASSGTWGWRVEGHHISLNYVIKDGKVVSTTPEFFGANPGTIDAGVGRTLRVLAAEEDLARQILKLCSPEQESVAWIDKQAPNDLRGANVTQPDTTAPVGLPVSRMSGAQKKLMGKLLNEYLKNMPADVEKERRARLEKAGLDSVYFAWWGDAEQHKRHYYRVQGPTFLIEYNNTQNNANHVHSYWRNLAGDFNIPLKRK